MDLLKKELERKKKALERAKIDAAAARVVSTKKGNEEEGASATTRTRFLNAAQLRKRQEEEEERLKKKSSTSSSKRPRYDDTTTATLPQTAANAIESDVGPTDFADGVPSNAKLKDKASSSSKSPTNIATKAADEAKGTVASSNEGTVRGTETSKPVSLSLSDITDRLRSMGLPVRLFGESAINDAVRYQRLQAALTQQQHTLASLSEKEEFRLGQGHNIRNPFLSHRQTVEGTMTVDDSTAAKRSTASNETEDVDDGDDRDDPTNEDPHQRIYKYLNKLLMQWQDDLAKRPDAVKQSVAGKNETKTLLQCQDYIRPLFKLLKKRKLEDSLTQHLLNIVRYCQENEFVKANDAYMDVAIGRAAWPIGVTMVGIHARTGRAKIESSNVAHVMNSELQRKYLTSVKRLMTYAQTKSQADPSKKVLN